MKFFAILLIAVLFTSSFAAVTFRAGARPKSSVKINTNDYSSDKSIEAPSEIPTTETSATDSANPAPVVDTTPETKSKQKASSKIAVNISP